MPIHPPDAPTPGHRWTRRQGGDRLCQEADGAADSDGIVLGADDVTGATVGPLDVVEPDGEHAANVAPKAKMMRRRLIMWYLLVPAPHLWDDARQPQGSGGIDRTQRDASVVCRALAQTLQENRSRQRWEIPRLIVTSA